MHSQSIGTSTAIHYRSGGRAALERTAAVVRPRPFAHPVRAPRRSWLACLRLLPSRGQWSWQAIFEIAPFRRVPRFLSTNLLLCGCLPFRSSSPLLGVPRSLLPHPASAFGRFDSARPHEFSRTHHRHSIQRSTSRQWVKSSASCGSSKEIVRRVRRPGCSTSAKSSSRIVQPARAWR
jgi:hypothetical protein